MLIRIRKRNRESTNKSVFADAFPHCPAAAFANVELQSGGATALAFFLFPVLSPLAQVTICLVCALLSVVRVDSLTFYFGGLAIVAVNSVEWYRGITRPARCCVQDRGHI